MKNRALEWILGALTLTAFSLFGFIGVSFDTRITKASDDIIGLERKRQVHEVDIAVMKEILNQVNIRTYQMNQQLDRIEKDIHQ